MRTFPLLLVLFGLPLLRLPGEMRSFINKEGRILPAEALSIENGKVTLKMQDGQVVQVSLSLLCEVDQKYLNQKFSANPKASQVPMVLDWKTSIAGDSGKIRKSKGKYSLSESQVLNITLTNQSDTPLSNLQLGYWIYLTSAEETGTGDPGKPARQAILSLNPIGPKQSTVAETPSFEVTDVVTGSTPAIHISQEQRKKVKGIVAVVFENDTPIYQYASPGLETAWKNAAVGSDGLAVPLRRLFPSP